MQQKPFLLSICFICIYTFLQMIRWGNCDQCLEKPSLCSAIFFLSHQGSLPLISNTWGYLKTSTLSCTATTNLPLKIVVCCMCPSRSYPSAQDCGITFVVWYTWFSESAGPSAFTLVFLPPCPRDVLGWSSQLCVDVILVIHGKLLTCLHCGLC